jgi:putative transposase
MSTLLCHDRLRSPKGDLIVLSSVPSANLVKVLKLADHSESYIDYEEVRRQIAEGELALMRNGQATLKDLYRASDKWKSEYAQATAVVGAISAKTKTGLSACRAYEALRTEQLKINPTAKFPARATVYRWLDRNLNNRPLLAHDSRKGNRTPRIPVEITREVEAYCEEYFAKPQSRWTISSLTALVNQNLREKGMVNLGGKGVSREYVRSVALRLSNNDLEFKRFDPRVRAAAKSMAKNRIQVHAPLDRVEIDAVHLPWWVDTPFGPTNRVHLIHAIDCSTSLVVGWQFVIGSPSVADTMQCLERIFFPKSAEISQYGCDTALDCYGTPKSLVFDNGSENKGPRIQGVAQLGVSINYCRASHPHEKPFIERLNHSLKAALETLPGCTRFDGVDGQRDPEELGDPVMTLDELKSWIVRWYFQEWAHTRLRRFERAIFTDAEHLGNTPAERFKSITDTQLMALPLPPNRERWNMLRFEVHKRKLSRKTGISFEDFRFKGDKLSVAIQIYGETEITILVDPLDFRAIYVPIEGDDLLIRLLNEDVSELTPAHSFTQAKAILKQEQENTQAHPQQSLFRQDLFHRSVQTTSPAKKAKVGGKRTQVPKQTHQHAKNHAALERASKRPMAGEPIKGHPVVAQPITGDLFTFSENVDAYIDKPRNKDK